MPLTLSELLERIRPAGTPGAPGEGEQQRHEHDRARELSAIAAVLQLFEDDADSIINTAVADAAKVSREAEHAVARIRGGVPDRIAAAQATAFDPVAEQQKSEQRVLNDAASVEIARLQSRADTVIAALSTKVLNRIWSILEPGPPDLDQP